MTTTAIEQPVIKPLAVIYLRVSTKDQATRGGEAEGFSIPAQREACRRKAESMGAVITQEFLDAGESAKSANRPELQKMLTYVADHRVGFVIVHKVDRLARNRVDDVEINLQLRAAGAQLVSCSENIDETPSGMLLHGIMSSIAEFYSRNLATETRKGTLQKVQNGGTVAKAPFGYLNTRERGEDGREHRSIALDPERAKWVRWIYERYAEGDQTAAMIRDELSAHGVTSLPTPTRPSAPLAVSQVHTILKNRYYVGVVAFEGIEYPGKHPALIDEKLFAEVQRIREARRQSGEKPRTHHHYLKGSVYCGGCGEPLSFEQSRNRQGKLYDYFYCLGRQALKNGCGFRATQAHVIEDLVRRRWATVTLSEARVSKIRSLAVEHLDEVLPARDAAVAEGRRQLVELQQRQQRLLEAVTAGALDMDAVKQEQERITFARAQIEARVSELDGDREFLDARLSYVSRLLGEGQHLYSEASPSIRRDLNQGVFERIFIDEDEVVGSDLTPAFRLLMSDKLSDNLQTERRATLKRSVRTKDLWIVPDVANPSPSSATDLPTRARRTRRAAPRTAAMETERPEGTFSWERKNPGPSKVRGSNESLLVAGAGFEPATSGL